ncbi:RING/U-box superfamily protein [Abeliophyllum distichum]|uniref:RING/U-box superfamily protein n=1 Tax=Abeliophyllum distichum TaxID=126358 RepID=A0ABD1R898_9LAMI
MALFSDKVGFLYSVSHADIFFPRFSSVSLSNRKLIFLSRITGVGLLAIWTNFNWGKFSKFDDNFHCCCEVGIVRLGCKSFPVMKLNQAWAFMGTIIAKTGSLCCVASRPHGSSTPNREWSVGLHEPYWRTNTSFSPPQSRWDFHFQYESLSLGSHDDIHLGSSASSNSRESRSWARGNNLANHHYLISDGVGPNFSPSDVSPAQQWTPPAIQEISADDYGTSRRDVVSRQLSLSTMMEGTSAARDSGDSTSPQSDSSRDYRSVVKSHHRNFSSHRSFMSKAIHPLSFPSETPVREANRVASARLSEFDVNTPPEDRHRLSASGCADLTEISESFDYDLFNRSYSTSDCFRCGLCERFLSQRSPWSSRRIVKSGDMPVAGVLSCSHAFHAECLEQTTPKACKHNPPCPICIRVEEENSPDQRVFSKLRNNFPRLKLFCEDGSSKPWSCAQGGNCVEGALHTPARNTLLSLNRNRFRKKLFSKGNPGREFPGKLRKSGPYSSELLIRSVERGVSGSNSTTTEGSDLK